MRAQRTSRLRRATPASGRFRCADLAGREATFGIGFGLACWLSAMAPLAPLLAEEQKLRFRHLSLEEGLSQTAVNSIAQDSRGFVWIGTEDGLNRYDGRGFAVFKHDPKDPSSLSHSWVWALEEDDSGRLWVGTNGGGLNRWTPGDDAFESYRHDPDDPATLSHDRVRAIRAQDGVLWIGTDGGGLNRFDPETGAFSSFRHDPEDLQSLSDDRVLTIALGAGGQIWVGTWEGGLNRFDPAQDTWMHYRAGPGPQDLADDHVKSLFEDRRGFLWIGTRDGGLCRFDPLSRTIRRFEYDPEDGLSLPSQRVRALFEDRSGTLWVGTDRGLAEWQPQSESFIAHRHDPTNRRSLSDDRVSELFEDRGGVLWVGTQRGGLNTYNPLTGSFVHHRKSPMDDSGLSSNSITSFAGPSAAGLWIGTLGGGLNRFDPSDGSFAHFTHDPDDANSLSDDAVMTLLLDRQGALWIGTYSGGLDRLDPDGERFEHYTHDPGDSRSLSTNGVMSLLEDGEGVLWIGTFGGGLNRFEREDGGFTHFRHDPVNPRSLGNDRVTTLHEGSGGVLWVGTDGGGVNRYRPKTESFDRFRHDPDEATSLSSDAVLSLHEDRDGTLWVGTQGNGLSAWRAEDRVKGRAAFRHYTERDGLPNDWVYGILSDDDGYLWLSTNNGLSKFDPVRGLFKNYYASHGLQSNEFNFGAYHRDANGRMYFGGIEGFNAFDPGSIRNNAHPPPVVLTAIFKANQRVELDRPVWATERLEIGHRDSVVSFEFAALDFSAPHDNRYAYRLDGLDDDWIDLGALPRATFTNLDPGRYTLRVRGSNNDGLWSEAGVALDLVVIPPPWRSWWAYSLYALLAAAVILAFVRIQSRKLEREAEYRRKLELEVRQRTHELEEATLTDPLTGLRNRRYLMTQVHSDLQRVERRLSEGANGALEIPPGDFLFLMVDLDGLKKVNDLYGHAAGDSVILQMRDLLNRACRSSDTIVRLAGDEFLVVGRDVKRSDAERVAERIRRTIREHNFDLGDGTELSLTCSIGFAPYPFLSNVPQRVTGDQVITIADRALYLAKTSGRDAWVGIYSTDTMVPDDLLEMINYRLGGLVQQGAVELSTSIQSEELVWTRRD